MSPAPPLLKLLPPSTTTTTKDSVHLDHPATGFTAVNGRPSPSRDPDPADSHQPSNYTTSSKRKRSASPSDVSPTAPSRQHSPPTSRQSNGHEEAARLVGGQLKTNGAHPHAASSEPRYASPDQRWTAARRASSPDDRFAETLKRGTEQLSDARRSASLEESPDDAFPLPDGQSPLSGQPGASGPHMNDTSLSMQKQRKRNFSNRTKTGCLTCRQRKKKCDEGKPKCQNCLRGGFQCQGYQSQHPIYKTPSVAPHPHLQAKNGGFYEPGQLPAPPPPPPQQQPGPPSHLPPSTLPPHQQPTSQYPYPNRPMQQPPPRGPPHADNYYVPGERDQGLGRPAGAHPPSHEPHSSMYRPAWTEGPPVSSYHRPSESHGRPAVRETPKSLPTLPGIPTMRQNGGEMQQFYANQGLAQLGDSRQPHLSHKERMLRGEQFDRHDDDLTDERDQFHQTLARFTQNATDTSNWSKKERAARFRQIFKQRREAFGRSDATTEPVAENVSVEVPFNCSYGYNVTIGAGVKIGRNVTFNDSAPIIIKPNVVIGDNVTITTVLGTPSGGANLNGPPMERAIPVEIGEWSYIGDGVTIAPRWLPATTIGRMIIIQPGSVVNDLARECHQIHPPDAKILRYSWLPETSSWPSQPPPPTR